MKMSEAEYRGMMNSPAYPGYCTECDAVTDEGVEPDAEEYQCPECEEHTVMGVETAFVCGHIEIEDE